MACQPLSLTVFYGHVLANSLRGNKVPGGPQLSSHVTFLALMQGRPVPLKVMFLLRKSLCHMWDRKNIYFESQSNHSELAQPFQELPGQQRKTSSEGNDGSLCCQMRDDQLPGRRARFVILLLRINISGQPCMMHAWDACMIGTSMYTPPTPRCRDLDTYPADREGAYPYTQHSWVLLDLECLPEAQVVKVWSSAHGTIGRFWNCQGMGLSRGLSDH